MEKVLVGLPSWGFVLHIPHAPSCCCLSSVPPAASHHPLSRAWTPLCGLWGRLELETPARKGFISPSLFVF